MAAPILQPSWCRMSEMPTNPNHLAERLIPRRLFMGIVCLVCLGLATSSIFTFSTLLRLRTQYLANRGREIAAAIESQARGQGRRSNPQFWQTLLEQSYETYAGSIAFLALVDQSNAVLAGKGRPSIARQEFAEDQNPDLFIFDLRLTSSPGLRAGMSTQIQGWRLRVGLHTSEADFIRRQAFIHLAVSGIAVLMLLALLLYLLRTLQRFLELKRREGAEQQLKALGIMAASLAHEIRNPLGAMKGLTQLAQEELPPDHNAQMSMGTVVKEAERLERLVSDLLDFARPREPRISEFNLRELISDIEAILKGRLESEGLTLQMTIAEIPPTIRSDAGGLRQVLLNVLINAIDASPKGGVVRMKAIHDERSRSLLLEVEDGGQGLGDGNPEELFQPFVTTKTRGSGLGLTVSRQVIERLGGSITLADGPQGGARCSIRVPFRR
jgi:signal transduction histidine kinase